MSDPKMTDAISRDAVLDRLETLRWNYTLKAGYREAMTDAIGEVRSAPALDVAPVVHARWVWNGFDYAGWECSRCNYEISKNCQTPTENYCPNCGARMDEEGQL